MTIKVYVATWLTVAFPYKHRVVMCSWIQLQQCISANYPISFFLKPSASFQPMKFREAEFSNKPLQYRFSVARPWMVRSTNKLRSLGLWTAGRPSLDSTFSVSSCGVFGHKVHDGCWRWHFSAHHACPSRVLQYRRLGLPILGFSCSPCPDQHVPAGSGHLITV